MDQEAREIWDEVEHLAELIINLGMPVEVLEAIALIGIPEDSAAAKTIRLMLRAKAAKHQLLENSE